MAAALLQAVQGSNWKTRPPLPIDKAGRFASFDALDSAHRSFCLTCRSSGTCPISEAIEYCLRIGTHPHDFPAPPVPDLARSAAYIPISTEELQLIEDTHERWSSEGVIDFDVAPSEAPLAPTFVVYRSKIRPGQEEAALTWANDYPQEVVRAATDPSRWPTEIYAHKPRGVYSLKRVNASMAKPQMAYPTLASVLRSVTPNCQLIVMDFAEGYTSVRASVTARDVFCCSVPGGQSIRHRSIPFGWRGAPFVFCFLSAAVAHCIKALVLPPGSQVVVYIDDIAVVLPPGTHNAVELRSRLLDFVNGLGFRVNPAKTQGPSTQVEFLGWTLSSARPGGVSVKLPTAKLVSYAVWVRALIQQDTVPLAAWRKLCGRVQFALQFTPGARPYIADLHIARHAAQQRGASEIQVNGRVREALAWILRAMRSDVAVRPWTARQVTHCGTITSDASAEGGLGAVLATVDTGPMCVHMSSVTEESFQQQGNRNSTLLEILAVEAALRKYCTFLPLPPPASAFRMLALRSDCASAVALLKKGRSTKSAGVNDALKRVFHLCETHALLLDMEWIPREANTTADALSHVYAVPPPPHTAAHFIDSLNRLLQT